jgi:hypothetical protein
LSRIEPVATFLTATSTPNRTRIKIPSIP